MTPKQLEQLKKSLTEEKKRIEKELGEISQKPQKTEGNFDIAFPEFGQSKDENAQEVAEFEKRKALEASLEKRLAEINEAIKKMGSEVYGLCQNCSKTIEEPRLKAIPTASLCSVCAKK